ncbi:MAG TPA: DUF4235 domain-containing protein [Thermoleophilaceae bacterium]|nr:DUF4235 domain-containing protein [Thermoleophilaceae bacterium]
MKLLYKPFGILFGVLGGLIGGAIFKQIWKLVSGEEDAPAAKESEYTWAEVLPAAALQGAIFALVKAAVDRGGAQGFQKLTGVWPGD